MICLSFCPAEREICGFEAVETGDWEEQHVVGTGQLAAMLREHGALVS
jgi:uncharacterized protein YbbK (DUF523 family)